MPGYFFNVYNGEQAVHLDRDGEELADRNAAWEEATRSTGLSIRDLDGRLKPGVEWRLEVTDEFANRICSIRVNGESDVGDPKPS